MAPAAGIATATAACLLLRNCSIDELARRQVDDAQPPVPEADAWPMEVARRIGAPMRDHVGHRDEIVAIHRA